MFEKNILSLQQNLKIRSKIMVTLTINQEEGKLSAALAGRLDTVASLQLEKDMLPLIDNADKDIVLDLRELEYISSSGLRLLLTLRKKSIAEDGSIVIKNIADNIRQLFTITGFIGLFDIE